jgi:polysaccharide biosynthesis transport protein
MNQLSYHALEATPSRASLALPSDLNLGNPAPPAVLSAPPTPWALLGALKRRWMLAASLGIVAAVVGLVVIWQLPLSWRARTSLQISAERPYIMFRDESRSRAGDFINSRSQLGLVKSQLVLKEALASPEIASLPVVRTQTQPIEWLESNLQVDFNSGPDILSIALTCTKEDEIADLVKLVTAVRNAYVKEIVNREQNHRVKQLADLEKLYESKQKILDDRLAQKSRIQIEHGTAKGSILEMQLKFKYEQLEHMHKELVHAQSRIRTIQNEIYKSEASKKKLEAMTVPAEAVEELLKQHPELLKLQTEVEEQRTLMEQMLPVLGNDQNHEKYVKAKKVLDLREAALEKRRTELRPLLSKQSQEMLLKETITELALKREDLVRLQAEEKSLDEQVKKKLAEISSLTTGTNTLDPLETDIATLRDVHKRIGAQREALEVELGAPSRISVLEDTFKQQTRTEKDRYRMAALVAMGLFLAAVGAVAYLEFASRRVSDLGQVTQGLGLRILGVLPSVPAARGTSIQRVPSTNWQRMLRESVDTARTMLTHAIQREGLRVVMVTSAVKGEGKTLLCSNLAVSMAQSGFKTLLIDADFRHPAIHRQFGLSHSPGMSDVLRGQADAESAMHLELVPGLTILTAGRWDDLMPEALAQRQRLASLLDRFKNEYDFILVDTAPLLVAPDSLMISQHVDGVLLSLLRGVSRLPLVYSACERLAMLGVRILGAVVGKADINSGYAYRYEARSVEVGQ